MPSRIIVDHCPVLVYVDEVEWQSFHTSVLSAGICLIFWIWDKWSRKRKIRNQLDEPSTRLQYADELKQDRFFRDPTSTKRFGENDYRRWLSRVLSWLDQVFGSNLFWSARGFSICVALAFIYSCLIVVWSWLIGVNPLGESLGILPRHWAWWTRLALFAIFLGQSTVGYFFFRSCMIADTWPGRLRSWGGLCLFSYVLIVVALTISTGVFEVFRPGMDHYSFTILLLSYWAAFLGCFCAAWQEKAEARTVVFLIAFTTFLALISAFADGFESPHDQYATLLFTVIPFANAGFDWLSLGISRLLARRLVQQPATIWVLVLHLGLDLFAAVVSLIGLAVILPLAVEIVQLGIPSS